MFKEFSKVIITTNCDDYTKIQGKLHLFENLLLNNAAMNSDTVLLEIFARNINPKLFNPESVYLSENSNDFENQKQFLIKQFGSVKIFSLNDDNITTVNTDKLELKEIYKILDTRQNNSYNKNTKCPINAILFGVDENIENVFIKRTIKTTHGNFNFVYTQKDLGCTSGLSDESIYNMKAQYDIIIDLGGLDKNDNINSININRGDISEITIERIQMMDRILHQITGIKGISVMNY